MRRQHFLLLFFLSLFFGLMLVAAYPSIRGSGDIGLYADIASRAESARTGAISELTSEYPPLISSVFCLLQTLNPLSSFHKAWAVLLFVCMIGAATYVLYIGREKYCVWFTAAICLTTLLLGSELSFARYDIFICMLLLLTWICHNNTRFFLSGFFLVLAASLKITPIFLIPFLLLATPHQHRLRLTWGMASGFILGIVFSIGILGIDAFLSNTQYFLKYHSDRGIQQESTWSGLNALWQYLHGTRPHIELRYGAHHNVDLGRGTSILSTLFVVGGLAAWSVFLWIKQRRGKIIPLAMPFLVAMLWMIGWAPVLSPQYFMWVLPLLFLWIGERFSDRALPRRGTCILLLLTVLLGWTTFHVYMQGIEKATLSLITLHNFRNLLIFVVCGATFFLGWQWQSTPRLVRLMNILWLHRWISLIIALLIFIGAYGLFIPSYGPVSYRYDGEENVHEGSMPLSIPTSKEYFTVNFVTHSTVIRPSYFRVKPDDCIESMTINSHEVPSDIAKFCDYGNGRDINLAPYLTSGDNVFSVRIRDTGGLGSLRLGVGTLDLLGILFKIFFVVLLCLLGVALLSLKCVRANVGIWSAFGLGVLLRILYYASTPYSVRGHDTDAHIDYIRYVAQHLAIPPAQDGWEFHQNPLYYVLSGLLMRLEQLLGFADHTILAHIQFVSLLLSIATLLITVWIARMLFRSSKDSWKAMLTVGVVGTIPSLIFNAARISNDVLYIPLVLVMVGLLTRFMLMGKWKDWYSLSIVFALAFLTKISTVAVSPVIVACYFLRRGIHWHPRVLHGAVSFLLVVLLIGWLLVLRLGIEERSSRFRSFGNEGMHSGLQLENTLSNFLTFNPVKIVTIPYNNPWSDETRRRFFWEYLYRSAFTGEFGLSDSLKYFNAIILLLGIFCLPLVGIGLVDTLRRRLRTALPLWGVLLFLTISSVSYRLQNPYSANQDFRFILIAVLPLAYLAVQGMDVLRPPLRIAALWLLSLFICCNSFFIVMLYFSPS